MHTHIDDGSRRDIRRIPARLVWVGIGSRGYRGSATRCLLPYCTVLVLYSYSYSTLVQTVLVLYSTCRPPSPNSYKYRITPRQSTVSTVYPRPGPNAAVDPHSKAEPLPDALRHAHHRLFKCGVLEAQLAGRLGSVHEVHALDRLVVRVWLADGDVGEVGEPRVKDLYTTVSRHTQRRRDTIQ